MSRVIDGTGLDAFRCEHLSPEALMAVIERYVHVLLRIGIGVGKSHAVDALLDHPGLYQRFDLVVCAAPTHAILRERWIISGQSSPPVDWRLLEPRPRERCGPRADRWAEMEKAGCGAYAKEILCEPCRARDPDPCTWPLLYHELGGVGLVFTTEQQLLNNRSLIPMLRERAGARRVLVILDEAQLLDALYEISLDAGVIERFAETVECTPTNRWFTSRLQRQLVAAMESLLDPEAGDWAEGIRALRDAGTSPRRVQETGLGMFGPEFRYVGFDLTQLAWSRREEQWRDSDGTIRFIARPYLHCHVLVLSAHLSAEYVGHRLGTSPVASPFDDTRFLHSDTRILNVKNRRGAQRHFHGDNARQILDAFAVILLRNVAEGRSTVLVARKKSKAACAEYLIKRLAGWGVDVLLVPEDYDSLPCHPDPRVIPVLHYGVRGVNTFEEYQSAYCLQGYYISASTLNQSVQEFEPTAFRSELEITAGADRVRRAKLQALGVPDLDRSLLGNLYLRRLEVDPVVQVAGRVRFLTQPREVVFFQMADLEREVGECEEVESLAGLLRALGLPTARQVDQGVLGARVRQRATQGLSVGAAAKELGVSRSTAFRALKAAESVKKLLYILIKDFDTISPQMGKREAVR